jgi:hypothetical protein
LQCEVSDQAPKQRKVSDCKVTSPHRIVNSKQYGLAPSFLGIVWNWKILFGIVKYCKSKYCLVLSSIVKNIASIAGIDPAEKRTILIVNFKNILFKIM